jgi:hypothetical protein
MTGARQSSAYWLLRAVAAFREDGNEKGRRGVTRGLLTGAQTIAGRWRNGGRASAPSSYGTGTNKDGRR